MSGVLRAGLLTEAETRVLLLRRDADPSAKSEATRM
jgi:hypothetical protein